MKCSRLFPSLLSPLRRLLPACLLAGLSAGATAQAADELPADLVADITGGDIRLGLPADFPLPAASFPGGVRIRLLGSLDFGTSKRLYLRATADPQEVHSILVDAYTAGDWIDVTPYPAGLSQAPSPRFTRLCHNQLGYLDIQFTGTTAGGISKFSVYYQGGPYSDVLSGTTTCEELRAYRDAGYPGGVLAFFNEQVPTLDVSGLSDEILPGARFFYGIASSVPSLGVRRPGFQTTQNGSVELPDTSLAELFDTLSLQLEDQDWVVDSSAIGSISVSSVWRKSVVLPDLPGFDPPQGEALDITGMFTLLDAGDGNYTVTFQMFAH